MNDPTELSTHPTPSFARKPQLHLVGLQRRYRCDDKSGIPAQWGEFIPQLEHIRERLSEVTYGICLNSTETEFDYFCGVEVPALATASGQRVPLAIPSQTYAVFTHQGRVEAIVDTVHRIFTQWLPSSPYVVSGHPTLVERYSEDFDPVSNAGSVEIWIPVRTE